MEKITIKGYDPAYQEGIDLMMQAIQQEFREQITSSHSTVIRDVYQKPAQRYWIALSGGKIVGTIGIVLFSSKMAEVKRMMVHPDYRGKSAGTAALLLNTGLEWAGAEGAKTIYLGTMHQFKAAQRFYGQNKFAPVSAGNLPAEYKINPMDTLFYKREFS